MSTKFIYSPQAIVNIVCCKFQKDDKLMPPPMSSKVRRRLASGRRGLAAAHSRSTPSTPDQVC